MRKIRITVLLFSLIACEKDPIKINTNTVVFKEFKSEIDVELNPVVDFTAGTAYRILPSDSVLVIFDIEPKSKTVLHNFNLKENQFSREYLTRGSGPNEVLLPFSVGINNGNIWLHDMNLRKIVSIENPFSLDELDVSEFFIDEFYREVGLINETEFLAIGNPTSDSKVQKVAINTGKIVSEIGHFHNVPEGMITDALKQLYQSFLCVKPTADKFVLLYRFTDSIEIFDSVTGESLEISGPEGIEIIYNIVNKSDNESFMQKTNETRQAFSYGAVTDNYIYALYSGKLSSNGDAQLGEYIYVYDWSGNPVKKIHLNNNKILSFTVTSDDATIYAFDSETGTILSGKLY